MTLDFNLFDISPYQSVSINVAHLPLFYQAQALSPIERDPYEGKVSTAPEPTANHIRSDNPIMPAHPDTFYGRPNTQAGGRNMQESSFSLSGMKSNELFDPPK